jgi:hypothetical protein
LAQPAAAQAVASAACSQAAGLIAPFAATTPSSPSTAARCRRSAARAGR